MLTTNEETPIYLEILNARDQPIMEIAARLRHLSAQSAVIAFDCGVKAPGLHWGSRIRFCVDSGSQRFAILGMVAATNLRDSSPDPAEAEDAEGWREILVRVWDCEAASQRRIAPRRRAKFSVKYQPLFSEPTFSELAIETGESETWLAAQCVDISAGGLRLRTACPDMAAQRVRLVLTLPATAAEPACELQLTGRVLRIEQTGGPRQMALIAVKFERLAPQDALLLARHTGRKG